jgi:hypothetical protein
VIFDFGTRQIILKQILQPPDGIEGPEPEPEPEPETEFILEPVLETEDDALLSIVFISVLLTGPLVDLSFSSFTLALNYKVIYQH